MSSRSRSSSGLRSTDDLDADELARALARAVEVRELQASSGAATGDEGTLKFRRNPLMEAAGIEPASADAPARASTSLGSRLLSRAGRWAADLPTG
jgi:hypothetical protein